MPVSPDSITSQTAAQQPQIIYIKQAPAGPMWNRGIAMVLSLLIPGLGQIYKGQLFSGLAWLVFVIIGYICFVIPGVILHLLCIIGAGSGKNG